MLSEIIIIVKLLIQRERGVIVMEATEEEEGETFLYVHVQDDNLFKNCM